MRYFLVFLGGLLIAGCASAPDGPDGDTDQPLEAGIWDVENGEYLAAEELIDRLEDARFVVVGESHGDRWHHDIQGRIYGALSDRNPGEVCLGMEMIERRFQPAIDDYLRGDIDEREMLSRVEWYQRWDVDDDLYAPMWQRARELEQPVVALNAQRELVRRVGQVGIDGLDDSERADLPVIDRDDRAYREHLRQVFALHDHGSDGDEELNRFFEAQLVWDETMAESAWDFMVDRRPGEQMVLLTGRGHMERGFGVPPRIVRRGASPNSVVTLVPVSTSGPRAPAMENYRNLNFLQRHGIADYIWIEP